MINSKKAQHRHSTTLLRSQWINQGRRFKGSRSSSHKTTTNKKRDLADAKSGNDVKKQGEQNVLQHTHKKKNAFEQLIEEEKQEAEDGLMNVKKAEKKTGSQLAFLWETRERAHDEEKSRSKMSRQEGLSQKKKREN